MDKGPLKSFGEGVGRSELSKETPDTCVVRTVPFTLHVNGFQDVPDSHLGRSYDCSLILRRAVTHNTANGDFYAYSLQVSSPRDVVRFSADPLYGFERLDDLDELRASADNLFDRTLQCLKEGYYSSAGIRGLRLEFPPLIL